MGIKEKRTQITFRISDLAKQRLEQASSLFNLTPAQYVKAVLYRDLGIWNEPIDRRKVKHPGHKLSTWERDDEEEKGEKE